MGLRRQPLDRFAIGTVLCAVLVAGPLIGLPLSFIVAPGALSRFSGLLPEAIQATAFILVGVGAGTFLLGTSLAALVSFFEFPGRRWIEWALVLPLAMPGYVFTLFSGRSRCSRSCSTRTCSCSPGRRSSASRARYSKPRAGSDCRAGGRSCGWACRSHGRRSSAVLHSP